MKKIKIGVAVLFGIVGIYFIVSYGIFLLKKPIIDQQIEKSLDDNLYENNDQEDNTMQLEDKVSIQDVSVQIQSISEIKDDQHQTIDDQNIVFDNQLLENDLQKKNQDIITSNGSCALNNAYSFVDMPIGDDYVIDNQTYKTLQILIGSNIDEFVKLILQSNNDLITAQICKSCTLFAFFKKIQHKKPLTIDEIKTLQKMLVNLYRFVQVTQNLSEEKLLQTEQYIALENLNRSGNLQQDIEQQAQKDIMIGALQKLLHMSGNAH
ncbi:MAG: hypothetical protein ACXWL5_01300 [Candidatus Chromulinivorax sp.]